jgi:hypothetical protein
VGLWLSSVLLQRAQGGDEALARVLRVARVSDHAGEFGVPSAPDQLDPWYARGSRHEEEGASMGSPDRGPPRCRQESFQVKLSSVTALASGSDEHTAEASAEKSVEPGVRGLGAGPAGGGVPALRGGSSQVLLESGSHDAARRRPLG